MSAKHLADAPLSASVLRGVTLHAQPHALVRPGRPGAIAAPAKVHPMTPSARGEPAMDPGPDRTTRTDEQAFADGRQDGYAAGHAAAVAEGRQALQEAIDLERARAADEGRATGLAEGRQQAQAELERARLEAADAANAAVEQRLSRLDDLLDGLAADLAKRLAEAEDDLVALGHEALCRILGEEAATPAAMRAMVKHLLARHGQRAQLAVHVHPDDLDALSQDGGAAGEAWRWVGDNSVQLGGVILRSPEGSLDARLETQLSALGEALLMVRRDRKEAAK
jgi:flagellar assembly protein FliH